MCGRKAAYAVIDKVGFMEPGTLCPSHYISWKGNGAGWCFIFQVLSGGKSLLNQYLKQRVVRSQCEEDSGLDEMPEERTLAEIKFDAILSVYERTNHHAQQTCKILRISKATFYREMKKNNYKIERRAEKKGG